MNEVIGIIGAVIGTIALCVTCYNWGYVTGFRAGRVDNQPTFKEWK
jgi:hypothetical protein